jgi:hypothetical protein
MQGASTQAVDIILARLSSHAWSLSDQRNASAWRQRQEGTCPQAYARPVHTRCGYRDAAFVHVINKQPAQRKCMVANGESDLST